MSQSRFHSIVAIETRKVAVMEEMVSNFGRLSTSEEN
jgi:hypothetical protein